MLYTLPLAGAGVTNANNDSLWLYTPGSGHTLLVREGSLAPGTAGATFTKRRISAFPGVFADLADAQREVRVHDRPTGGDVVPGVNDRALYAGTVGGGLTLIARNGQPAPGTDAFFRGSAPSTA